MNSVTNKTPSAEKPFTNKMKKDTKESRINVKKHRKENIKI